MNKKICGCAYCENKRYLSKHLGGCACCGHRSLCKCSHMCKKCSCSHSSYSKMGGTLNVQDNMLDLWDDHGLYTLLVMQSKLRQHSYEETTALSRRLLKNQNDIGNVFKMKKLTWQYISYGDILTELLREHITIAARILDFVLAQIMQQVQEFYGDWKNNALRVGTTLYKIQQLVPMDKREINLPEFMWQKHMLDHLALLFDVVVSYSQNKFDSMIIGMNKYMTQIREMGRMIALLLPE